VLRFWLRLWLQPLQTNGGRHALPALVLAKSTSCRAMRGDKRGQNGILRPPLFSGVLERQAG